MKGISKCDNYIWEFYFHSDIQFSWKFIFVNKQIKYSETLQEDVHHLVVMFHIDSWKNIYSDTKTLVSVPWTLSSIFAIKQHVLDTNAGKQLS